MIPAIYYTSEILIAVSAILLLIRIIQGPSVFDRVAGVEALALAVIAFLLLEAYTTGGRLYTDAALSLALFSFTGTVLFGFFLGREEFPDE